MPEQVAPIPLLQLTNGCQIRFEAIDPSTGSAVSGVTVAQATLYADDKQLEPDDAGAVGPFMLIPGPDAANG